MENPTLLQTERDSIAFMGLMAIAYQFLDEPRQPDDLNKNIHTKGLNIFAIIVKNQTGELASWGQNTIHSEINPLKHAEQMALDSAIIKAKKIYDKSIERVEDFYMKKMFNDGTNLDFTETGHTLYTTLEPCPFCASALLVSRMKRVVYVLPDSAYGGAFPLLKSRFYKKNIAQYNQLKITPYNGLGELASMRYYWLLAEMQKQANINGITFRETLVLDNLKYNFLKTCFNEFATIGEFVSDPRNKILYDGILGLINQYSYNPK